MTYQDRRGIVSLLAATAVMLASGCSRNRAVIQPDAGPGASSDSSYSDPPVLDATGKSIEEVFHGKFVGVDAYRVVGGGLRIKIRNGGGLNQNGRNPVYVVDGLEVAAPDGALYIDPDSITRIEVERGSPLYGKRGANGIVWITTRK
jgi:outer membrane receptor protein involved in Fe transport